VKAPLLGSGILLAAVAAALLNLFFNCTASGDEDSRLWSTSASLPSQPLRPRRRDWHLRDRSAKGAYGRTVTSSRRL
jgi:hypothetical protein